MSSFLARAKALLPLNDEQRSDFPKYFVIEDQAKAIGLDVEFTPDPKGWLEVSLFSEKGYTEVPAGRISIEVLELMPSDVLDWTLATMVEGMLERLEVEPS
jgi:hypothetical protein